MTAPVCQFQDRLTTAFQSSAADGAAPVPSDGASAHSHASTPGDGSHSHSHDLLGAAGHGHEHGGTWTPEVRLPFYPLLASSPSPLDARWLDLALCPLRRNGSRRSLFSSGELTDPPPSSSCSTGTRTSTSSTPASLPSATCPTGPAATGRSAASRSASEGASLSGGLTNLAPRRPGRTPARPRPTSSPG